MEAVQLLQLDSKQNTEPILILLDRLCAMLTRLARLTRQEPVASPDPRAASPSPPSDTNSNTDTDSDTLSPAVPVRSGPSGED